MTVQKTTDRSSLSVIVVRVVQSQKIELYPCTAINENGIGIVGQTVSGEGEGGGGMTGAL